MLTIGVARTERVTFDGELERLHRERGHRLWRAVLAYSRPRGVVWRATFRIAVGTSPTAGLGPCLLLRLQ
jgi:hypothetical protein